MVNRYIVSFVRRPNHILSIILTESHSFLFVFVLLYFVSFRSNIKCTCVHDSGRWPIDKCKGNKSYAIAPQWFHQLIRYSYVIHKCKYLGIELWITHRIWLDYLWHRQEGHRCCCKLHWNQAAPLSNPRAFFEVLCYIGCRPRLENQRSPWTSSYTLWFVKDSNPKVAVQQHPLCALPNCTKTERRTKLNLIRGGIEFRH